MEKFKSIIILILLIWPVCCAPLLKRNFETLQFNKSTEVIAVDYLIDLYHKEYHMFCNEEIGDGYCLQWPALDNKNLSDFCKKYIEHSDPRRSNAKAIEGSKIWKVWYYTKEIRIPTVCCKITMNQRSYLYYMTRAPQPNCVYAMSCSNKDMCSTIINKHCDFEKKMLLKQRIAGIIGKTHHSTGQPIAKDKYLREYELAHQELTEKEGDNGKQIEWPYAISHVNLDDYCYQFLRACTPSRTLKDIKGICETGELHYHKLNTNKIIGVTTIKCRAFNTEGGIIHYHMTRAPETNCVFSLVSNGHSLQAPLVIAFKYCDFQNPNDKQTTSQDYISKNEVKEELMNTPERLQLPKTEVKKEIMDTLGTLQLPKIEVKEIIYTPQLPKTEVKEIIYTSEAQQLPKAEAKVKIMDTSETEQLPITKVKEEIIDNVETLQFFT